MASSAPLNSVDKRQGGIAKKKGSCRIMFSQLCVTPQNGAQAEPNCEQALAELWQKLDQFLRETFVPSENRVLPQQSVYMELYSKVHNLCLLTAPIHNRSLYRYSQATSHLPGQLYDRIKGFLEAHLRKIVEAGEQIMDNKEILLFYSKQFHDFEDSSKLLDGICKYMNRTWITEQQLVKEKGLREVLELALCTWRDTLFNALNNKVTGSILEFIYNDRISKKPQFSFSEEIKEVIKSYIDIGSLYESSTSDLHLFIYSQSFEEQFLATTRDYYASRLNKILNVNNPEKSILKIESIIRQEEARVRSMLHESTLSKMVRVCVEALVLNNVDLLYTVFENLLERRDLVGLKSFYAIIKRISQVEVQKMATRFQDLIAQIAVKRFSNVPKHPVHFCTELTSFISEYKGIVKDHFEDAQDFRVAMDRSCTHLINTPNRGFDLPVPKFLAEYTHRVLGNTCKIGAGAGELTEEEVKLKLKDILQIIPMINDKDLLGRFLKHNYGNRLLWDQSYSHEMEESFIQDLTVPFSKDFTRKLQQMYHDTVHLSRTYAAEFAQLPSTPNYGFNFHVHVLASASWDYKIESHDPKNQDKPKFIFPKIFEKPMAAFAEYYSNKYPSKKLEWLPYKAGGELKYNAKTGIYNICVSTYEMTILLLYNDVDEYTLDVLVTLTKLELDKVVQLVVNLIHYQLLTIPGIPKLPSPNEGKARIQAIQDFIKKTQKNGGVHVKIDHTFRSKKRKFTINMQLRSDATEEEKKLKADIERARTFTVQAVIVKIMKAQKTLRNQELISQTAQQCQETYHYFPEVSAIETQINNLIEREYLTRPANDPNGELQYVQ